MSGFQALACRSTFLIHPLRSDRRREMRYSFDLLCSALPRTEFSESSWQKMSMSAILAAATSTIQELVSDSNKLKV